MLSILEGGWHFNRVALASVLVGIVAIDGPLLQRASRVTTMEFVATRDVTVGLVADVDMTEFPTGYSSGRAGDIAMLTPEFLPVVQSFSANEPIDLRYLGCNGTCITEIVGPGLDVQCVRSTKDFVLNMTTGSETPVVSFTFSFGGQHKPGLIELHTDLPIIETPTKSSIRDCKLRLSQVRYQVQLNNGTVQMLSPAADKNNTIKTIELYSETKGAGQFVTTLGGLYLSADRKWSGSAYLMLNGAPFQLMTSGETPLIYLNTFDGLRRIYTWEDPTDIFIASMRELMFRTAIAASRSPSLNSTTSQTVVAREASHRAVYDSRYEYLAAAFAVMLAAILATSSNLFGWWQLERAYSIGPFEIAKAFNAPFLKEADYLGTSEKGFQAIEKKGIQYGEHADGDTGSINVVMGGYESVEFGQDIELLGGTFEQRPVLIGMGSPKSYGV